MKSERNYGLMIATVIASAGLAVAGVSMFTASADDPAPVEPASAETTTESTEVEGALLPQKMWEREHQLRNGETVTCLYVQDTGLSCDWAGVVEYGGEK